MIVFSPNHPNSLDIGIYFVSSSRWRPDAMGCGTADGRTTVEAAATAADTGVVVEGLDPPAIRFFWNNSLQVENSIFHIF